MALGRVVSPEHNTTIPPEIKSSVPSREHLIEMPRLSQEVSQARVEAQKRVEESGMKMLLGEKKQGWLSRLAENVRKGIKEKKEKMII